MAEASEPMDENEEEEEEVLPGDLDMTMEEMTALALVELIEEAGEDPSSPVDPNSPPPRIPEWFQNAYNNF